MLFKELSIVIYMNQFEIFITEKLVVTNSKTEIMNRNNIYECYYSWFYYDNVIIKTIFLASGELLNGKPYIPSVLKYDKIIGRVEFYKLLIENYGQPPFKNKITKQYSYYFKKL